MAHRRAIKAAAYSMAVNMDRVKLAEHRDLVDNTMAGDMLLISPETTLLDMSDANELLQELLKLPLEDLVDKLCDLLETVEIPEDLEEDYDES